MHWWSEEEKEWLSEQYKRYTIRELLPMFNEYFNVGVTYDQLKGAMQRYKIRSGRTGKFEKGQTAWNKDMKGLDLGGSAGWFKKGTIPPNHRPVGSERVNVDGYIEIKVADPNKWRAKHVVVWEKANGSVPKGYVIIFGDGDKQNIDLDNLILVSRKQLVTLNKKRLIQKDVDLTRVGILIADIYQKMHERKKSSGLER